jgi:predicted GNAT superfamily acetyltransferase
MTTASPLANALLALNNDHAQELSRLTHERLPHLVGEAFLARRIGHVDADWRGCSIARCFAEAARAGHSCVVCEINSEPPNPASHAFHEGLGFAELGSAAIHNGSKTVRYLLRRLDHQAAVAGGSASTE